MELNTQLSVIFIITFRANISILLLFFKYFFCNLIFLSNYKTSFICRIVVGQYVSVTGGVISHVNISDVRSEDGGSYTCTAINRAGSDSHTARLNVYGKLIFSFYTERNI